MMCKFAYGSVGCGPRGFVSVSQRHALPDRANSLNHFRRRHVTKPTQVVSVRAVRDRGRLGSRDATP